MALQSEGEGEAVGGGIQIIFFPIFLSNIIPLFLLSCWNVFPYVSYWKGESFVTWMMGNVHLFILGKWAGIHELGKRSKAHFNKELQTPHFLIKQNISF